MQGRREELPSAAVKVLTECALGGTGKLLSDTTPQMCACFLSEHLEASLDTQTRLDLNSGNMRNHFSKE